MHNGEKLFKQWHASLTPPTNYPIILLKCFLSVQYVIPLLLIGALASTSDLFLQVGDKKTKKNRRWYVGWLLLAAIFSQWWCPVASTKALDLLHQALRAVLYRRTAVAIKMASKVGAFFHCCFVCCCPGGCWGNTEQVVAQWQCPEASSVALDMLHQVIQAALHPCIRMAIKMACNGGAFVLYCHSFAWHYS